MRFALRAPLMVLGEMVLSIWESRVCYFCGLVAAMAVTVAAGVMAETVEVADLEAVVEVAVAARARAAREKTVKTAVMEETAAMEELAVLGVAAEPEAGVLQAATRLRSKFVPLIPRCFIWFEPMCEPAVEAKKGLAGVPGLVERRVGADPEDLEAAAVAVVKAVGAGVRGEEGRMADPGVLAWMAKRELKALQPLPESRRIRPGLSLMRTARKSNERRLPTT